MKIFINEKQCDVEEKITLFQVRDNIKPDADVLVINGWISKVDKALKEEDKINLIKKGEVPSKEELEHLLVARHTPGVHEKVKQSKVGIAGLGGLGSNVAISLARLGIGELVLVDFDVVEPSNLNRQQYYIRHIGMKKTEAIKELLTEINPFVKVKVVNTYLDETNIEQIFEDVDIVVEAFDNPVSKATIVNTIISKTEKTIVAASGMAGSFSSNTIQTKKMNNRFYLIGDGVAEAKEGQGLMAPRVAIAANHQANTVLRIIVSET